MSELQEQVKELVCRTIADSTGQAVALELDTSLIDEGYLDSLTVLQLFTELQDVFEVELDMDDVTEASFGTVAAIAALIDERR